MDTTVDKLAWQRQIPIEFQLATPHNPDAERPEDAFYLMVPAISYLPFCFEQLVEHFGLPHHAHLVASQRHQPGALAGASGDYGMDGAGLAQQGVNLWFSYEDIPLKWHIPVGVLFDTHTRGNMDEPWRLTVHTRDYPHQALAPCAGLADVERIFLNRLKESTFIKHNSVDVDALRTQSNLKQIWAGVVHDDFDEYNVINSRINHGRANSQRGEYFHRFPFVVHVVQPGKAPRQPLDTIQEPFDILDQEGVCWTLGDLVRYLFADYKDGSHRVIIHGVEPPLDTPLQWLTLHMAHADNFVYIVVELPSASTSTA